MNELTTVSQDDLVGVFKNDAVTTSLRVAEVFEKRHKHVLRSIENLVVDQPKNGLVEMLFSKSTYTDEKGERRPMYFLNRDGFSLLVMGFTGKKALEWKLKYIRAFNEMEKLLLEKQSDAWRQARIAGKLTRHSETDTIKNLWNMRRRKEVSMPICSISCIPGLQTRWQVSTNATFLTPNS